MANKKLGKYRDKKIGNKLGRQRWCCCGLESAVSLERAKKTSMGGVGIGAARSTLEGVDLRKGHCIAGGN